MDYSMLLYVHLCNVDKIKYKTIEKDFYRFETTNSDIDFQLNSSYYIPV